MIFQEFSSDMIKNFTLNNPTKLYVRYVDYYEILYRTLLCDIGRSALQFLIQSKKVQL